MRNPRAILVAGVASVSGLVLAFAFSAHADTTSAALTVAPNPLTFDGVAVGNSDVKSVHVNSTGTAPLQVTSVSNTGRDAADFAIVGQDCTGKSLAPGSFCTVSVRFTPSVASTRVTNLRVASNACTMYAVVAGGGDTPSSTRAAPSGQCGTVTTTETVTAPAKTVTTTGTTPGTVTPSSSQAISLSTKCTSRRTVTLNLKQPKKATYTSVAISVDGKVVKRLKATKKKTIATSVSLKGLSRKRVTITVNAKASNGKSYKRIQHFVTCVPKA